MMVVGDMKYRPAFIPIILVFQFLLNIVLGVVWIMPGTASEIPYGITVDGRDISGFEPQTAASYLKTIKRNSPIDKEVILSDGDNEWALSTRDYKFRYDYEKTIGQVTAYLEKHKGIDKVVNLLKLQAQPVDMPMVLSWDHDKLREFLESINDEVSSPAQEASLEYKNNEIVITVSRMGVELDYEKTLNLILDNILSNNSAPVRIAKRNCQLNAGADNQQMFDTVLASFVTELSNNKNRTINIQRASDLIDGAIVQPGEIFSFNNRVGKRNKENGFTLAPVIINKQMVNDIGGGICQVATTLYNASILAGLPIIERHPHSVDVKYVPHGQDAAVVYGSMDLKIMNNRLQPISIRSKVVDDKLVVAILGSEADNTGKKVVEK
jgi:vancomycin resistance protein YoaR